MDIIGQRVSHEVFGSGEIVGREKNGDILVYFAKLDEQKRFQCPAAFGRYLKAEDKAFAEQMSKEGAGMQAVSFDPAQIKLPPRENPAEKNKANTASVKEKEAKPVVKDTTEPVPTETVKPTPIKEVQESHAVADTVKKTPVADVAHTPSVAVKEQTVEKEAAAAKEPTAPTESVVAGKPVTKEREKISADDRHRRYTAPERVKGVPQTYFVLQGGTFASSSAGGYIWAPYSQNDGVHQPYWDSLEYVEPGDIIIHGEGAKMKAVSCVKAPFRESDKPVEFATKTKFTDKGRKIDCEYHIVKNPVPTKQYRDDIIRLVAGKRFSPFNNLGNGNNGYLYDLDGELAKIFLGALVEANPELKEVRFIVDYLKK